MTFADDQHPVRDLGPGGEHEPLRVGVRPGTAWRNLRDGDPGAGEHGVEGVGELPGPIPDDHLKRFGALPWTIYSEGSVVVRGE